MHQCQTKKSKTILRRGLLKPLPYWGVDTPSPGGGIPSPVASPDSTPSAPSGPRFSRVRRSAFPFLFTYDSNTANRKTTFTDRSSTWCWCRNSERQDGAHNDAISINDYESLSKSRQISLSLFPTLLNIYSAWAQCRNPQTMLPQSLPNEINARNDKVTNLDVEIRYSCNIASVFFIP